MDNQIVFDFFENHIDNINVSELVDTLHGQMRNRLVKQAYIRFNIEANNGERDYLECLFVVTEIRNVWIDRVREVIFYFKQSWLPKINSRGEKNGNLFQPSMNPEIDRPLKDSGERRDFETGSRRDVSAGKGRYDLLPFEVIDALAKHYEKGQNKYDATKIWDDVDNWKKGQPLSVFADSALRHSFKGVAGESDEDHIIAAIWNLIAYWYTQNKIRQGELPIELGDIGELWLERRALTKKKE